MPGVIKSDLADYVADLRARREAPRRRREDHREVVRRSRREAAADPHLRQLPRAHRAARTSTRWSSARRITGMRRSRSPPSNAGKDVYLQKPFTMTHAEGVILRDAVKRHGRILQVGSQQRSWEQFRRAAELIRSGRIGNVQRVEIGLPTDPTAPDAPPQAVPANLDFGQWLGPTPFKYYTEMRVHPQADYSRPGWLRHEAHCLGMITGWGSHHYDTMHWALQFENTGPSKVEGKGEFPDPERIWNVHGAYDVTLQYPQQRRRSTSPTSTTPASSSIGDEGWIWVTREGTGATSSDPQAKGAEPAAARGAAIRRSSTRTGVTRPSAGQQVASQELARERALAQAAAGAGAHRPSQQHRLHRELDRHEARPAARVGSEDRALQERRRSQLPCSRAASARLTARCIWPRRDRCRQELPRRGIPGTGLELTPRRGPLIRTVFFANPAPAASEPRAALRAVQIAIDWGK